MKNPDFAFCKALAVQVIGTAAKAALFKMSDEQSAKSASR
jgi:hypothetical protein